MTRPTPSDAQPVAIRYRPKDAPAEPWRYTDDDHASVLGVLGERIGLYDIEPLYPQSALDAERQKREAAERDLATALDSPESDWQPVETLPKDGRSVMVWLAATVTERPHAFAPVSVCEDGSWWDDSTGDQIEPFSAVYWKPIQPPNALTNIEKERDDGV